MSFNFYLWKNTENNKFNLSFDINTNQHFRMISEGSCDNEAGVMAALT